VALILAIAALGVSLFTAFFTLRRTSLTEYREEVRRLIAELNQVTDRDSRLVEERVKALKSFLEEADRRMVTLFREGKRSQAASHAAASYADLARRPRPSRPSPDAASPASAAEKNEDREKFVAEPIAPKPPPVKEQVAALVKAGLSPEVIAPRLGITLAEVELAISIGQ